MSNIPWKDKRSLLDITHQSRGAARLSPLDMGYLYIFNNGETRHFMNDREAYEFYEKNTARLNQPYVEKVDLNEKE